MTSSGAASMSRRQPDFLGDQPPSFAPLDPRADRIGVIDVGSNSVRMVVFEGHVRSPATLFNEKVMCGLGAALGQTGRLDPEGRRRALAALKRFVALAPGLKVKALAAVATAAVREAHDGQDFVISVKRETGIRLQVASGTDEARLAAKGVLFGNPRAEGVVVDLGGASMELCEIGNGQVGKGVTTPLGPQRLCALPVRSVPREIDAHLAPLAVRMGRPGGRLWLVGGAWRALARLHIERTGYPLEVLHEYALPAAEAQAHARWVAAQTLETLAAIPIVAEGRVANMPVSGLLLEHLIDQLAPSDVVVSGFGLREGVCLDNLPRALRDSDPLLAACSALEDRRARDPGFGAELADWVLSALEQEDPDDARLVRAAALLSDVQWRTHPDYRASSSWETVTRASITDIGHAGRVALGVALIARHRRHRRLLDEMPQSRLLGPDRLDWAWRLGLVLRLGSTIAASATGVLARTPLSISGGRMVLTLDAALSGLAGEEVEKRLGQAARAMGLEPELAIGG